MKPPTDIETLSAPDVDESAAANPVAGIDQSAGNFSYNVNYEFDAGTGLNADTVRYISSVKKEADWILDFRLKALKTFLDKPMPTHWATKDLENINFDKIRYYLSSGQKPKRTWDEVPDDIKKTFERLGIPEQERKFLAGVEAQFDSEAVYSNIKKAVGDQGVVYANDIQPGMLALINRRLSVDRIRNVTLVEGTESDPQLPPGAMVAARRLKSTAAMPIGTVRTASKSAPFAALTVFGHPGAHTPGQETRMIVLGIMAVARPGGSGRAGTPRW